MNLGARWRDRNRTTGSYTAIGVEGLVERAHALEALQSPCTLCPRRCLAMRARGERGFCGVGTTAVVASWGLHFGEESVLVGRGGSGTVFLAGCNLGCVFCQNYSISHLREGKDVHPAGLARIMLELQEAGAENINWVTPTHVVPQLVMGLAIALGQGLTIPLVYNCGGYESPEALSLLEGVVDIYLPDAKFSSAQAAADLAGAPDYFPRACRALRIMHRQVGGLVVRTGVACRGVLVRHLVMPNDLAGSARWARAWKRLSGGVGSVNVMAQYRACYLATQDPRVARRPSAGELERARRVFLEEGLRLVD